MDLTIGWHIFEIPGFIYKSSSFLPVMLFNLLLPRSHDVLNSTPKPILLSLVSPVPANSATDCVGPPL